MYYFVAHYIDVYNDTEITRKIVFDGQFFSSGKECYLYAMARAYDMTEKNEMFASLEFIAC